MNESCHMEKKNRKKKTGHSREGSLQVWMSHVTHMNESCCTYEWVMLHIRGMSHVAHMSESCHTMNESCRTYEWVMSHLWMSYVTPMNESCHTYEWVMSHLWMSHVTPMNESCHTYEWTIEWRRNTSRHTDQRVMSHISMSRAPCGWDVLHMRMSHVTHMTWLIRLCCTYE